MSKLIINKVHASQFKSFTDKSFDLYQKTDVIGRNAAGKSTFGTACVIPFTGKSLDRKSNPELHPDFMKESEPAVTLDCSIDGKPIQIEFRQKDVRTKKQKEANAPVRISNQYTINGVAKSEKDYKADLLERGIDVEQFERLTSPNYFNSLKEADKRSAVFAMASSITDMDVAVAIGDEVANVRSQLENYKLDEIESMAKSIRKRSRDRLDAIPEQIIGLEKGKPDLDGLDTLKAKRQRVEATAQDVERQISEFAKKTDTNAMDYQIRAFKARQRTIVREINEKRDEKINKARSDVRKSEATWSSIKSDISYQENVINRLANDASYKQRQVDQMLEEYNALKESTFPERDTICPTCGQTLPKDQIESAKAKWQMHKDNDLSSTKETGNILAKNLKAVLKELDENKTRLAKLDEQLASIDKQLEAQNQALAEAENVPVADGTDNKEYKELSLEIKSLEAEISKAEENASELDKLKASLVSLKNELSEIDRELGKQSVVEHIDNQIAELREEQKTAAQSEADAEKVLYQIGLMNQKKNEMLSESVNEKFPDFIKFKLFMTQKNGEVKDCCVPMIRNDDGEWKDYNLSANNSLKLRADIAILTAFQKHSGMSLPIVIDNAECLDTESKRKIESESQLIFLTVVDDLPLTVNKL